MENFKEKPLRFIFFIAKKNKKYMIIGMLCVLFGASIDSATYYALKGLTDSLGAREIQEVYFWLMILFLGLFFSNVFWRGSGFSGMKWITGSEAFSIKVSFDYLIEHSYRYFADRLSGSLASKISNIFNGVESILAVFIWNFWRLIITFSISTILTFSVAPIIGIIFLLFIIFFVIFNFFASKKVSAYAETRANKASALRGIIVDIFGNILAVKQNVSTKSESEKIDDFIEKYRKSHLKVWWHAEKLILINNALIILLISIIVGFSIHFWSRGVASTGDIVMIISLLFVLYRDLEFMGQTFNRFMQQHGQIREGLKEIFNPYEIVDHPDAVEFKINKGEINFRDVKFNYEEDNLSVFEEFNLKIPAGQKVGIVGESGAGKSTFIKLLLRFVDIDSGNILIDNRDIKKMRQEDIRDGISYVPQEPLLFHRTLRENIKYGNPKSSDEEMLEVAKNANVIDFVNNLPKGFDTLVGERGIKLSGGQKQRIMIARAMIKNSPILVLDEATSSLDSLSEKLIQSALEKLMEGRTTIVIAHRLSTLKKMDRIVVFDGGKIIEDGSHNELLAKQGKYYELWKHQVG